jgi:hypothetical protein
VEDGLPSSSSGDEIGNKGLNLKFKGICRMGYDVITLHATKN